jgi:prepilin-type N-terminal cleavage/methylation domain-containing protein/prepilin-type processing-associated H-X9-DG protein
VTESATGSIAQQSITAVVERNTINANCPFSQPTRKQRKQAMTDPKRRAFTLVELLVVIAIIAILIGMSLPAIQSLRESSRRSACVFNLTKISLGLSEYSLVEGAYPAGSIDASQQIANLPEGYHHNWVEGILPMIDYNVVSMAIDDDVSIYAPANAEPMANAVPVMQCPSATMIKSSTSCYAGLHHPTETPIAEDNLGCFILNRRISEDDIVDGLAATLLVGEKLDDQIEGLGWLSGTRASLRNGGHPLGDGSSSKVLQRSGGNDDAEGEGSQADPALPEPVNPLFVGGLASRHAGGVNGLMADGSTHFLTSTIDLTVLQQMIDRQDGSLRAIDGRSDGGQ